MLIDIYIKFIEDILNRFQFTEQTKLCYKVPREITQKVEMQELWFLHSAHCLMLIDIFMKFYDNSLNDFQVIVRTRLTD